LEEREILWAAAPHIIWPMRFVLPYRQGLRPAWMLRAGLFFYDHIGGRRRLRVAAHEVGLAHAAL
jgi:glycerol-3-phosphate dehydrogenase